MITNRELFDAQRTLQTVLQRKLPVDTAIEFAKLIRPINRALSDINERHERMLAYHHATLTADGRQWTFTDEARPKFYTEWDALMDKEICVRFAPLADEWIERLQMTAGEVTALLFLFTGGENAQPN